MSLENPTQEELEISWLSDVHKEAYGFRPRGDFWAKWDSATTLEREEIKEQLGKDCNANVQREWIEEQERVIRFEQEILEIIKTKGGNRHRAFRDIILEAEVGGGKPTERDLGDAGYLCFCLGLPYHYEHEIRVICEAHLYQLKREAETV